MFMFEYLFKSASWQNTGRHEVKSRLKRQAAGHSGLPESQLGFILVLPQSALQGLNLHMFQGKGWMLWQLRQSTPFVTAQVCVRAATTCCS